MDQLAALLQSKAAVAVAVLLLVGVIVVGVAAWLHSQCDSTGKRRRRRRI